MWIFTKNVFLSVVQASNRSDCLLVRGRVRGDVQRFFPTAKVYHTVRRDYAHRAIVPRESVAARLAVAVQQIDYGGGGGAVSFKDSIADKRRAPYYLDVWDTMWQMQYDFKA